MNSCPARYEYGGLFTTDDQWIHPVRRIKSYELILVLCGEIYLFEENNRYVLRPGEIILLHPDRLHGGYLKSTPPVSFYWIHFQTDSPDHFPTEPIISEDAARLNALCRQLLHIANTPDYPDYAKEAAFDLLYAEVMRTKNPNPSVSRLIGETAEWIRINRHKKLTVEGVAKRSGYHPDYLSSLFRTAYQINLKQYIDEERMKAIRDLLITTNDSVKQLAQRLDFDSEEQLIHFFRYHEGISPVKWRNLYHNTHLNRS